MLHEMLAGDPPFSGPTPQAVVMRHLNQPPPRLRDLRGAVPERIEAAVATALEKAPADRFASAGDFAAALVSGAGKSPPETPRPPAGGSDARCGGARGRGDLAVHPVLDGARSEPGGGLPAAGAANGTGGAAGGRGLASTLQRKSRLMGSRVTSFSLVVQHEGS
jgi:hypothetical protein